MQHMWAGKKGHPRWPACMRAHPADPAVAGTGDADGIVAVPAAQHSTATQHSKRKAGFG